MSSFSITITVDTAELERIGNQLIPRTDEIIRNFGLEVEGRAKIHAPWDTRALINSIKMENVAPAHVRVAPHVDYAIYQELGFHHWISGKFIQNPFIVPAVEDVAPAFINPASWAGLFE